MIDSSMLPNPAPLGTAWICLVFARIVKHMLNFALGHNRFAADQTNIEDTHSIYIEQGGTFDALTFAIATSALFRTRELTEVAP